MSEEIIVVLGTYNRLGALKEAIGSIRETLKDHLDMIAISDGGSKDGTREWLLEQRKDIASFFFEGPLTGAVKAFNQGFAWAVCQGAPYVMHFNDDAILEGDIEDALDVLDNSPSVGEVAFAFDLWTPGSFHHDHINGVPYANYGLIRREAGIAVAKAQGDDQGLNWWDPSYFTYAADTQFGVWLWKLGYRVHSIDSVRVRDLRIDDALRANNSGERREADSKLFWSRWRDENLAQYLLKLEDKP